MYIDTCIYMCMDMCMDMCIDMRIVLLVGLLQVSGAVCMNSAAVGHD